jgi:hypothetical protein
MFFLLFCIFFSLCSSSTTNQKTSYSFHGNGLNNWSTTDENDKWGFSTTVSKNQKQETEKEVPEKESGLKKETALPLKNDAEKKDISQKQGPAESEASKPAGISTQEKKEISPVSEPAASEIKKTLVPEIKTEHEKISSLKRSEIVDAAKRLIGIKDSFDKNPMIWHILKVNNINLKISSTDELLRSVKQNDQFFTNGKPEPGDIVFLSKIGSGKNPELYQDAGIVEKITESGTVIFIIYIDGAVKRLNLNINLPDVRKDEATGEIKNSIVRKTILVSKIFYGFGKIL